MLLEGAFLLLNVFLAVGKRILIYIFVCISEFAYGRRLVFVYIYIHIVH